MNLKDFIKYVTTFKETTNSENTIDTATLANILIMVEAKFKTLTVRERLSFFLLAANNTVENILQKQDSMSEELSDIERQNKVEMIHLRTWLVKFSIKSALAIFIVISLAIIYFSMDGNAGNIFGNIIEISKKIGVLFIG
jgi:hypothetical protein